MLWIWMTLPHPHIGVLRAHLPPHLPQAQLFHPAEWPHYWKNMCGVVVFGCPAGQEPRSGNWRCPASVPECRETEFNYQSLTTSPNYRKYSNVIYLHNFSCLSVLLMVFLVEFRDVPYLKFITFHYQSFPKCLMFIIHEEMDDHS